VTERFDYVVVGSGSAGGLVALRLAQKGDASVLLLEAGTRRDDEFPHIVDPSRWQELIDLDANSWFGPGGTTEVMWQHRTVPQPGWGGRVSEQPRGRVLGGTSTLNSMVYVRGHASDFDSWAYDGAHGWDYASVLPSFKALEDYAGGADDYHGVGGPLPVRSMGPDRANPVSAAFIEAGVQAGHPLNPDHNGASMTGVGWLQANITADGRRASSAESFVRPALGLDTFTLRQGARVHRLVLDGDRCVGVEYVIDGRVERVEVGSEVVLCGGAYESPRMLMLSGIGPADELRRLGIEPLVDLAGVGQNLQDHMLLAMPHEGGRPVPPGHQNLVEAGLFMAHDRAGLSRAPGLQIQFGHICTSPQGYPKIEGGFTISPTINRPLSRGQVRLRSADPDAELDIDPNYYAEPADLEVMLLGLEVARDIVNQPAMKPWWTKEVAPGAERATRAELAAAVRECSQTVYHPVGTCKMGTDELAVVDPQLRVRGVEGVRVADASIMPSVTSGNTQAPIFMIGQRAAELIG
jgi:choline dehydrogenase